MSLGHEQDRRHSLWQRDDFKDKRNVSDTMVGEFSYMAYDNLYSEIGKLNQLSDKLPNLKGDISYEEGWLQYKRIIWNDQSL